MLGTYKALYIYVCIIFSPHYYICITLLCRYDAFYNTRLKGELHKFGVDTVVICGTMTNLCCETTARVAFVNDFNVIFLHDGNATSTQEFHDATIKNLAFGFAVMKSCREFIDSLA